jgi:uncharacterized DUF497 family protein
MKVIKWNEQKNKMLKNDSNRGISFDDIMFALNDGNFYKIEEHYNQDEYNHQSILYIEIKEYIYIVPFVENSEEIFFKTVIPSRKYTKIFLKGKL